MKISDETFAEFWENMPAETCECDDCKKMTREAFEAAAALIAKATIERCAEVAKKTLPRAHTYSSENADLYDAQDQVRDRIIAAILAIGEDE